MPIKGFHGIGKYLANYLRTTLTFEEILQSKEMGHGLYFYTAPVGISIPSKTVLTLRGSRDTTFDVSCVLSVDINIKPDALFIDTEDATVNSAIHNILSSAGERIQGNPGERYISAILLLLEGNREMRDARCSDKISHFSNPPDNSRKSSRNSNFHVKWQTCY